MKGIQIVLFLVVMAWPLYYLYERQLGAISFLVLAIFFGVISYKETKKLKEQDKCGGKNGKREKIK
ncbi:hypothetical protein [Neobacillus muris]|uniref:hypothetical protein n=1 Tax=Neobacillus muris TaxID=2941334 RepID=UPI0020406C70|nr:hypothetical protein [Neobacillus muris]